MNFLILILATFTLPLFASLNTSDSQLILLKGPEEFCGEGPLKTVGEKENPVLMVGSNLSLFLHEKTLTSRIANEKCQQTTKNDHEGDKIIQVTSIAKCSPELKKLESVVTQELLLKDDQVIYKRVEGKQTVLCVYQRKLK